MPDVDHPIFTLCDYAEVINGKLYVMGAGITNVLTIAPANLALGILLPIPWNETNRPQKMQITLVTDDGEALPGPDGKPYSIDGKVEVGRPVGAAEGMPLPIALAVRLPTMMLQPNSYRFELHLNGSLEAIASFRVLNPGGA